MLTTAAPLNEEGCEDAHLLSRLNTFLATELKADQLSIEGFQRASYGFSCENWPFDLQWSNGAGQRSQNLILRRDPEVSVLDSDRETEFQVLKALENYGDLPTPRALWLDADGRNFGRPATIMVRCKGVCDPMVLSGGILQLTEAQRLDMAHELMDAVLSIHGFDWRGSSLPEILPVPRAGTCDAATQALDHWEGEYRRNTDTSFPEYEYVIAWLRSRIPVTREITLVHGDFKPGNVLIADRKVSAVLDWETAHLGDPVEDLGWVTNPLRSAEHQIEGQWEAPQMLAYYSKRSGRSIDPDSFHWWGVFANFKLLTIWLTGLHAFLAGRADRPMGSPRHHLAVLLHQMEKR